MMEWISTKDSEPEHGEHVIGLCSTPLNKEMHVEPLLFEKDQYGKRWYFFLPLMKDMGLPIKLPIGCNSQNHLITNDL